MIPDPTVDPRATAYELFPAKKYVYVAAILSNQQRTARYALNRESGVWYDQAGWKRVGRRLPAATAAYAQSVYNSLQPLYDDRVSL